MKIIFLDVDGVLNDLYTEERFVGYVFVDDEKIMLLKKIVDNTDAQIVLSSTWRRGWYYKEHYPNQANEDEWLFEALQSKLNEYGLELFDYTEELGDREKEITLWLEKHKDDGIESYVILDDADEKELRTYTSRFVQTDISDGLTECVAEEAIRMLNQ